MNRCENCHALSALAHDYCPACGSFGMLLRFEGPSPPEAPPSLAVDADDVPEDSTRAVSTGFEAWDEALSGGLVLGSTLVLYGDPGSRKTTWAGAIADAVACARRGRALFLSAEMPSAQVRDAVLRIRVPRALSIIGAERDASALHKCMAVVEDMRPRVVVYDSLQAFDAHDAFAGQDFAIKAVVQTAKRAAARLGHAAILISQVNKASLPSGPYRTIHDCDVVARVSIDRVSVKKNRFGPAPRDAALA